MDCLILENKSADPYLRVSTPSPSKYRQDTSDEDSFVDYRNSDLLFSDLLRYAKPCDDSAAAANYLNLSSSNSDEYLLSSSSSTSCDDESRSDDEDSFANYSNKGPSLSDLLRYTSSGDESTVVSTASSCSPFDFNAYSSTDEYSTVSSEFDKDDWISEEGNNQCYGRRSSICTTPGSSFSKKVRFGEIQIQEYAVTVGVTANPDVVCPIQLDWQHTVHFSMDLRDYECLKGSFLRDESHCINPLTVEQRRKRIATVLGISVKKVHKMESSVSETKQIK